MTAFTEIAVMTILLLWLLPQLAAAIRDWAASVRACVAIEPDAVERESRYERFLRVVVVTAYLVLAFGGALVFVVGYRRMLG